MWKLHTQACEIVAGTKRKLCKKFQVDTCKTKKDRSAHAQLRTLWLRSKPWFIMRQESGGYLQNFKSIHAKLKKIDVRMHSCAKPWFIMQQRSGGYLQNSKSIHAKLKKKIDLACAVAHLVVKIQAMIYNAARVRRLSTKFQVYTCKTKKDRSAHAQLAPCSWNPSHDL